MTAADHMLTDALGGCRLVVVRERRVCVGRGFTFEGILGSRLLFSTAVFELDRAQWTL